MVMHWKTVMQAKIMLSKEVMPKFGPWKVKVKSMKTRRKKPDLPFLKANRCGGIADISSGRRVFGGVPVARNNCIRPVAHYFVWKLGFPLGEFGDLLKMNWDQFRGGWNKLGQLRCLNWFLMSFRSWDLMGWSINQVYFKLHLRTAGT